MDSKTPQKYCVSKHLVVQAFQEIHKHGVKRTPTIQGSLTLIPKGTNFSLFFKAESFQRSGSFKFRGATNAVAAVAKDGSRDAVIVTVSSGNFAQGAALAAKNFGLKAKIVMPNNTTPIKINAVRSYGAEIEFCHPNRRDEHCAEVVRALGPSARFVHPSEDPRVIAGNGTLFIEMMQQVKAEFNQKLHIVVCPVGGGGVISGVSAVAFDEGVLVIGAEPAEADDAYRSKQTRSIQSHRITGQTPHTIAEGLRTTLGPNTFPCVRDWVDQIVLVSEKEIVEAMRLILERLKVVAEASSCVAYAAVRTPEFQRIAHAKFPNEKQINVGIVLTGGNVDFTEFFARM